MKTKTKKPTPLKEMTKGEIRESALKQLQYHGCSVWPQNNLAVRGRRFIGKRGLPDIIGYTKDGKFLAAEVKTVNDFLTEEQKEFLSSLNKSGGIGVVAKQDENGKVILEVWVE